MRYHFFLALAPLALALIPGWTAEQQQQQHRGPIAYAAAAPPVHAARARLALAVEHQATAQTHSAKAGGAAKETAAQVVSEVDLEGLKKLLERGRHTTGKDARALLVNFWATWCEPCREEFPDLVRINTDYSERNLDFITVSLDDPAEIKSSVPEFLRQMRAPMPAYLLNVVDPEIVIKAVDPEWGGGLPATFLYDASGRMVFKHTGRVKAEELRAAIDKVTSGK